jgi:rSAM/selenodomain-associated transferase 1
MALNDPEPVAIAILAKAPIAGFAKTRLTGLLGAERAAALQERLIHRAVETAIAAAVGPVTLWASPDQHHPAFATLAARHPLTIRRQPDGDLGARMLAAIAAADGPAIVIGTDCPALTVENLRIAAAVLRSETDAVMFPADDGGYGLIGMRSAQPKLFEDMTWSTGMVAEETRARLTQLGLSWREPVRLWDVDTPADVQRMRDEGFGAMLAGIEA